MLNGLAERNKQYVNLSLGDISGVTSALTLPVTLGTYGVKVKWSTSNPERIDTLGNVIRPLKYNTKVTLTATLSQIISGKIYTMDKSFLVTVLSTTPTPEQIAIFNFKPELTTLKNDTLFVTDGSKINVLNLANGTGYFDMGYDIGQIMYNTYDFTLCAYYYIDPSYTEMNKAGNFLWTFSNTEGAGGQYVAGILKDQSMVTKGPNSKGVTTTTLKAYGENRLPELGKWHHIAYTQFANIGYVYIDGVFMTERDMSAIPAEVLSIAGRSGTLYNWLGRSNFASDVYLRKTLVSDFRFYSRALDATDFSSQHISATILKLNDAMTLSVTRNVFDSKYKVYSNNSQLVIEGLTGLESVSIYNMMGQLYDKTNQETTLLKPGVYTVKIDQNKLKVIIK